MIIPRVKIIAFQTIINHSFWMFLLPVEQTVVYIINLVFPPTHDPCIILHLKCVLKSADQLITALILKLILTLHWMNEQNYVLGRLLITTIDYGVPRTCVTLKSI